MALKFINYRHLPAIELQSPDGAQAIVTLFGAHLVSWKPKDGRERLFCSEKAVLGGGKPVSGGIPLVFPQFNYRGDCAQHGFARIGQWDMVGGGVEGDHCLAEFRLASAGLVSEHWPFAFSLTYTVKIQGDQLDLALRVDNTDTRAFSFSAALHSYFHIEDLASLTIAGLQGAHYSQRGEAGMQQELLLRCSGNLDRIYHHVNSDLTLSSGAQRLSLHQDNFSDVVLWNPGQLSAQHDDLGSEEFRQFICIEPAVIDPLTLEPGGQWLGRHRLRCG